ncbi:histidine kinase 2 [Gossypium raimondii]|uniref:histidine kinase n=2 Tax=Gossypium raimondii TaxID=29730 RepID=A0A0D2QSP0_GOSRA|nr:histidine kinase 2 [Gossypium raimondii]XP_052489572.1 histidine kinase 2 [Gossypium raimondii]XP_052489573.1 histidine kinase 2 [Gossypium raimondii]XP_052489574.1 histidine kinase 2 [Gossypium raimondii]XP_052489575.1 histidine kinase 2 [Gossypium raimondii]XP_052489576.1 histidine kinase 2 [Gossypium raimondii]XP_052489577.1 histidine kinase 2 [Gossypium raimondii]XP_052489578.1 histidine kinase 2 [Gossypium raimondii]XP_052489579.1 histidine kinase 2 [Gossypium raimondii]XP_05248958
MSCSSGTGNFVKLSGLLGEIHRCALVKMSMNGKFPASTCRLPANSRLKKAKEIMHRSNSFKKWNRYLIFLWLLGFLSVGFIWFLTSVPSEGTEKIPPSCEDNARILLQHFNVSKNQLHALASFFYESDQVAFLECSRHSGPEKPSSDDITCALNVLCSKKPDFEKQMWVAKSSELKDQCPVRVENTPSAHDLSFPEHDSYVVLNAVSSLPWEHHTSRKNISRRTAPGVQSKDHCENLSFCMVKGCWLLLVGLVLSCQIPGVRLKLWRSRESEPAPLQPVPQKLQLLLQQKHQQQAQDPPKGAGKWRKKLLIIFVLMGILTSIWLFWHLNQKINLRREETLTNMCDERARMLQDQFNVSMNHVHALALLVSTFHHGKHPSAIDQKTFGEYTERTAFERPLTSGVAYALKVLHSEREQFEKQHGWTIKKMETEDQTLVQDCLTENLDPAPVKDEYAPVIFSQETVSHIVSIDMMSGKEDRENILRARATGKGVLTSPFKLLKSNHVGVVLTFAVYNKDLPPDATPELRIEATMGYLGASYDVPSLVEKLLHQLASNQTIVVNVYDTTNSSASISMYGTDVTDTGLLHVSSLDFGDPLRKHEMHCRFKQKPPLPWTAINASLGVLVITLLVGHIFHAAISRIAKVENDYREMMELKARAEAADIAKSQFLATVSHEIRTPMNGVLGMLKMLMDTDLDAVQRDYAETAHASGKDLISLINEVLDQAKIESGRLELEDVPFDLRSLLDNVLSLSSDKSNDKGIELAVYVSDRVPEVVVGDPGRFRQIIINLVGNSIKFTQDKGHIFVSVHLVDEVKGACDVGDKVLQQGLNLVQDMSSKTYNTLSGFPVVDRWRSWENFKTLNSKDAVEDPEKIKLLVTVEDTGVGIHLGAQDRIFTPFVQADSSTSRHYGGTGIGLSISKHLVELMHGEIGFVSEPGIGSTFSFTGSFAKGEVSSLDSRWKQYDPVVSEFQGLRALVVDNRSIRAEVTRYHLRRLGISVDITLSMESTCTYLSNACGTSDFAHLAMILIDKDAWNQERVLQFRSLLKEHRQNGRINVSTNFPKIFLLATAMTPLERSKLKTAGFVDNVLMKPLRLSVIIACFQELLGNGRKDQVHRKKSTLGTLLREKRILVVDDNKVNRRVAEGALKKYGAIVSCVEKGQDALDKLRPPHNFDACFMDLQMPEMDGFEATRQIRSVETQVNENIASGEASIDMYGNVSYWHIPILAMTADVIQATNEECMKCGMDGYVSKPFEEEQLYSAVASFFESG